MKSLKRGKSTRKRNTGAQAILETAIVIPILFYLIFAFIGIMIQVETQQALNSATRLAVVASFQAPNEKYSSNANAISTACTLEATAFLGTMNGYSGNLIFPPSASLPNPPAQSKPNCSPDNLRSFCLLPRLPKSIPATACSLYNFQCWTTAGITTSLVEVGCSASTQIDFQKTAIGFAIFWNPVLTSTALGYPPPYRQ